MHVCMRVCMHVCDWSADYMNQLNSLTEHMNHWFVGCPQNHHRVTLTGSPRAGEIKSTNELLICELCTVLSQSCTQKLTQSWVCDLVYDWVCDWVCSWVCIRVCGWVCSWVCIRMCGCVCVAVCVAVSGMLHAIPFRQLHCGFRWRLCDVIVITCC